MKAGKKKNPWRYRNTFGLEVIYDDNVITQSDEGIDIYYNKGDGRFEATRVVRFPPVYGSNHIDLADFNGDGLMDVVVCNATSNSIRLLLNNGDTTFTAQTASSIDRIPYDLDIGDLDRDGDIDLVATTYGGGELLVWMNQGGHYTLTAIDIAVIALTIHEWRERRF